MKNIKVFYCPVEGEAKVIEKEDSLQATYKLLDTDVIDMRFISDDGLCIVIDDEGRFKDKPTNPHFYHFMNDYFGLGLVGDYLIVRTDEEGADVDLTPFDIKSLQDISFMETLPHIKAEITKLIKEEEKYIRQNPEVLAPKVYPLDIDEFFKNNGGK